MYTKSKVLFLNHLTYLFPLALLISIFAGSAQPISAESTTVDDWFRTIPTPPSDDLYGVICLSENWCKGVGDNGTIIFWDGSSWNPESSGTSALLRAISCLNPTTCWAVGFDGTVLFWDGAIWQEQASPTASNLTNISCLAAGFCKAVGYDGVIISWNGTEWIADNSGQTRHLIGLSCLTTSFCKAAGISGTILSWDGTSWTADQSNTTSSFYDISCVTENWCQAVGISGRSSVWDGNSWTSNAKLFSYSIRAVSCPNTSFCLAVGDWGKSMSFNGNTLAEEETNATITLRDVFCVTENFCKAVGLQGTIFSWNGTNWTADNSTLYSIDCPTTSFCKATGDGGQIRSWNGATWTDESLDIGPRLRGVSCPTTDFCMTVGSDGKIFSWNGNVWTEENSPTTDHLRAISCPTTDYCLIVGSGDMVTWNNGSWQINGSSSLTGVYCQTKNLCHVVGHQKISTRTGARTWTSQSFDNVNNISDVSCTTETQCMAVGDVGNLFYWNGDQWSTSKYSGIYTIFGGIDCPTTTLCKIVGWEGIVVSRENGSMQEQNSDTDIMLNEVSCPNEKFCKAVGQSGEIITMVQQTRHDVSAGFNLDIQSDNGCLTELTITETQSDHPNATVPLKTGYYWDIDSGSCDTGFLGSLSLPAVSFEANNESKVCRYGETTGNWDCAADEYSTALITRHQIAAFSDWTAGNLSIPFLLSSSYSRLNTDLHVSWASGDLNNCQYDLYHSNIPYSDFTAVELDIPDLSTSRELTTINDPIENSYYYIHGTECNDLYQARTPTFGEFGFTLSGS